MNKDNYTIIDLGSNSFHMLTVCSVDNGFSVVDKSKQKVRLAAGLNDQQELNQETMEIGWDCLKNFKTQLVKLSPCTIIITATAALRLAKNSQEFIDKAEAILQHPIKLISGIEEAKTIYQGVVFTEQTKQQLLVLDIGGASTEVIIGKGKHVRLTESLEMGCVTWLNHYFSDQALNEYNFERAINAAKEIIKPHKATYQKLGWELVMGASGTIQAMHEINNYQQATETLTLELLYTIKQQCIHCGSINTLTIEGLKNSRKPVFASGLAILIALFESFEINHLKLSKGALREGLISQLFAEKGIY